MATNERRIGYGLLFPLVREASDFAAGTGKDLLSSCVRKVVSTRAAGFDGRIAGEYPWRKGFGSWIHLLRHSNIMGAKADLALVYLAMGLQKWEPRVQVDLGRSYLTRSNGQDKTQRIRLYFSPQETSSVDTSASPYEETYQEATL